jgi:hypothetical protein
MAVMNTTLFSNPKRVMQMLWLAAGIMFSVAIIHSFQLTPSTEWMSSKVQGMMSSNGGGGGGRSSMKDHIQNAEAVWAKTVKQRHDLIRADWGTVDKMPM